MPRPPRGDRRARSLPCAAPPHAAHHATLPAAAANPEPALIVLCPAQPPCVPASADLRSPAPARRRRRGDRPRDGGRADARGHADRRRQVALPAVAPAAPAPHHARDVAAHRADEANATSCASRNSAVDAAEIAAVETTIAAGDARIVFKTPERLADAAFVELVAAHAVSLLVVDEAHCVSHRPRSHGDGRDREVADCTLFLHSEKAVQQFFIAGRYPAKEDVAEFHGALQRGAERAKPWTLETLHEALDRSKAKLQVALRLLRHRGVVEQGPRAR